MHQESLIRMANQIGTFFEAMPDRDEALFHGRVLAIRRNPGCSPQQFLDLDRRDPVAATFGTIGVVPVELGGGFHRRIR